ncbi:protein PHLOEM PROTEIN 2-LIKE A9-like [Lycium barbarum]|uniref:protein PHLOEM PROTEIN 2-LIKE A9-like n=1 Tax=Lycium barbarum TaxID=112863 RepID=UPI00293E0DDC|nr:protein PHLOEM PROTEIN 2-LIKE A9-like [Lycium barbarum]
MNETMNRNSKSHAAQRKGKEVDEESKRQRDLETSAHVIVEQTASKCHYLGNHTFCKTEKGYIVYPKALNIVWGNDERFWRLPKYENDVAELIQINWLEVTGCIDNIVEKKSHDIGFTMSLMTDAFGWNDSPVYIMAKWGDNAQWRKVNLTSEKDKKMIQKTITITKGKGNPDDKLCFGLYEVWNKTWKGGLKIHCVNLTERS